MFYYISFLRPPPLQVLPFAPVTITPQVANDLRTESFEDSQDIYYSWSLVSGHGNPTKPTKLTTWKLASAYKEITVPPPPGLRDGQSWRLILCSEPQRISINLNETEAESKIGKFPFPVISMPINFTRNASKKGDKQEQIERHYRFTIEDSNPASVAGSKVNLAMRITEQISFDLDKKIWDSGIGLSSWLVSLANNGETSVKDSVKNLKTVLLSSAPRNIIELGAGTGIVALTLGALRSRLVTEHDTEKGCMICSDLPSAMPLLEHNVSANSTLFSQPSVCPRPEVLDWEGTLPSYIQALRGKLDAIIMADVTYNTASFPALIRTLTTLIELNPIEKPPVILLGYKERDAAERSLWTMAEKAGICFEHVGEKPGAGGAPIEIWIGEKNAPQ